MSFTDQTFAPTSGTAGDVRNFTTQKHLAGLTSWKRQGKAAPIPIPHFRSGSDVQTGTVQGRVLKGLGDNTVALEGIYNLDPTAQTETGTTGLTNGAYVSLDLVDSTTLNVGYPQVLGWITDFQHGTTINNQASSFTCTLTVDGVFPTWGALS